MPDDMVYRAHSLSGTVCQQAGAFAFYSFLGWPLFSLRGFSWTEWGSSRLFPFTGDISTRSVHKFAFALFFTCDNHSVVTSLNRYRGENWKAVIEADNQNFEASWQKSVILRYSAFDSVWEGAPKKALHPPSLTLVWELWLQRNSRDFSTCNYD